MLTYIPQHESISPSPCPVRAHPLMFTEQLSLPGAPRTWTVPLPSPTPTTTSPSTEDGLFPLDILRDLPLVQQLTLRSIILTTPIHVHVPGAHLGIFHSAVPGQRINALELIHCLRATYSQPTQRVNMQAEIICLQRAVHSSGGTEYQNQFTSGQRTEDNPVDPLLGDDEVWGLEPMSFEGYSIVHLAGQ